MKVLVVVDAQNDFITGSLGSTEAKNVLPKIVEKIRNFDDFIICTLDTHFGNYLETQEGRNLPVKHCIREWPGWFLADDIYDVLKFKSWMSVQKRTFGSYFLPRSIENFMLGEQIEEIELVGYVLDICVISNALMLKAFFPEVKITVDVSCCAATSPEAFEAAKTILKSCQIEIRGE